MKKSTKATKSQLAYQRIRQLILQGRFSDEHPWSLRELAQKFKMSVVPVTEAIRRLEQEGILQVHPQRGISIRRLSIQEIRQANVIREGMEIQAARLVAQTNHAPTFEQLMKIAQKIEQFAADNRRDKVHVWDYKLHKKLVEASGCKMLVETYENLLTMSVITTAATGMNCFHLERIETDDHVALIEAIASANPDKAERAIRNHINSDASK